VMTTKSNSLNLINLPLDPNQLGEGPTVINGMLLMLWHNNSVLNTVAIVVLLRAAGTCLRDPAVTPLFFVLGIP
ncbi:MAG: hypothetical protein ACK55I_20725, partial [bacterium]